MSRWFPFMLGTVIGFAAGASVRPHAASLPAPPDVPTAAVLTDLNADALRRAMLAGTDTIAWPAWAYEMSEFERLDLATAQRRLDEARLLRDQALRDRSIIDRMAADAAVRSCTAERDETFRRIRRHHSDQEASA